MLSPLIRTSLLEFRAALERQFGARLRLVRLFGSWARGQANEASDVDVAVVIDELSPADWKKAYSLAGDVELSTALPLSPLVLSSDRYQQMILSGGIAREIARDGIAP